MNQRRQSFLEEVQTEFSQVFNRVGAVVVENVQEKSHEAYVTIHLANVGLNIARDSLGTIIFRIFPVPNPNMLWPIDYLFWLAEGTNPIPATIANRKLSEWATMVSSNFEMMNELLSPGLINATVEKLEQISVLHRRTFNEEFGKNPRLLSLE